MIRDGVFVLTGGDSHALTMTVNCHNVNRILSR